MIEKNEVNWWSASCGPHQSNSPNQLKKVNFLYWLVNWLELPPPTIALLIDSLNSSIKCRNGQHSCGGWVCLHSTNLLFIQHKSKKFDFVDEEKNVEWFVEFEFDLSLFSLSSRSVWPLCRPITHHKERKTNQIHSTLLFFFSINAVDEEKGRAGSIPFVFCFVLSFLRSSAASSRP